MITLANMQYPIYMHPPDGQHFVVVNKLTRANKYGEWCRSMKVILVSKRKVKFVTSLTKKDTTDNTKKELWETCKNKVIARLTGSMNDTVKKSVRKQEKSGRGY